MHKINVLIDNKRYWIKEFPCLENFARLQMRKFFSEINFLSSVKLELTILFTSGKRVKELNKKFRNKNTDTDVLSFPSMSKDFYKSRIKLQELYLGDIALSYDYIKKKSVNFNLYTREMMAHGFLHLIGYDHNNKKNHSIMIKKQLDLLTL